MSELAELNARIERAEHLAIGKAMCGKWTRADSDALQAMYDERRRVYERKDATDE